MKLKQDVGQSIGKNHSHQIEALKRRIDIEEKKVRVIEQRRSQYESRQGYSPANPDDSFFDFFDDTKIEIQ